MAYAIVLITTDGNLSSDGRHFDFTSNDVDLIETFKHCLNLKNRIARKRSGYTNKISAYRIQFGDVVLYRKLVAIGLMPNKSKRLGILEIPDKFFFDFLRGHLDGDGSVKRYFDPIYKNSLRLYVSFLSASEKHIQWIRHRIKSFLGNTGSIREHNNAYYLVYSKKDSIKLINSMYYTENLPCLKRKFDLIKDFIA